MSPRDFTIFSVLLDRVHKVAFGEALAPLPYQKARSLSWDILEATGHRISYKSLASYAAAVEAGDAGRVNPYGSTLGVLVQFSQGRADLQHAGSERLSRLWFQFRKKWLEESIATGHPSRLSPVADSQTSPASPSSAA